MTVLPPTQFIKCEVFVPVKNVFWIFGATSSVGEVQHLDMITDACIDFISK